MHSVPVERRSGVCSRQFRSVEQKRQMVQETPAPGASVAIIARRHDINAYQLFSWRRKFRRGVLELVDASASEESALIPIVIAPIEAAQERSIDIATALQNTGRIDIEFSGGRRVTGLLPVPRTRTLGQEGLSLKLNRTDIAQRRMSSSRIVEALDVVEHVGTSLVAS